MKPKDELTELMKGFLKEQVNLYKIFERRLKKIMEKKDGFKNN